MRSFDLSGDWDWEPDDDPDEPPPDSVGPSDEDPSIEELQRRYYEEAMREDDTIVVVRRPDRSKPLPPARLDDPPRQLSKRMLELTDEEEALENVEVHLRDNLHRPDSFRTRRITSEGAVGRAIETSLDETAKAFGDCLVEKGLEVLADLAHPGLGHLISIGLKVQEAVGDVEALVDPESGSDVHVPLLKTPPGFEIELSLHLPGHDGAGTDGPWVSGFLSPGDGGLFGGWAIEREEGPAATEHNAQRIGQNAGQVPETVIQYPLAKKMDETDPLRRTAHLREAALKMLRRLQVMPQYEGAPIIVIYDEAAGCGLWMIRQELADAVAGRCIEIRYEYSTGWSTVLIT